MEQLVIYAKDIMALTRCSRATAYRQMEAVKKALGRQRHEYISPEEYCTHFKIDYQKVKTALKLSQ